MAGLYTSTGRVLILSYSLSRWPRWEERRGLFHLNDLLSSFLYRRHCTLPSACPTCLNRQLTLSHQIDGFGSCKRCYSCSHSHPGYICWQWYRSRRPSNGPHLPNVKLVIPLPLSALTFFQDRRERIFFLSSFSMFYQWCGSRCLRIFKCLRQGTQLTSTVSMTDPENI
jgi:hypothetical protein